MPVLSHTTCLDMRHGQEWAYWAEVKTGMGQSLKGYEKKEEMTRV